MGRRKKLIKKDCELCGNEFETRYDKIKYCPNCFGTYKSQYSRTKRKRKEYIETLSNKLIHFQSCNSNKNGFGLILPKFYLTWNWKIKPSEIEIRQLLKKFDDYLYDLEQDLYQLEKEFLKDGSNRR